MGSACCVISSSFPAVGELLGAAGQISNLPLRFLIFNSFGEEKPTGKPRLALSFGAARWLPRALAVAEEFSFPFFLPRRAVRLLGRCVGTVATGRVVLGSGLCRQKGHRGDFVPSYRGALVRSHQSASSTCTGEVKTLQVPTAPHPTLRAALRAVLDPQQFDLGLPLSHLSHPSPSGQLSAPTLEPLELLREVLGGRPAQLCLPTLGQRGAGLTGDFSPRVVGELAAGWLQRSLSTRGKPIQFELAVMTASLNTAVNFCQRANTQKGELQQT